MQILAILKMAKMALMVMAKGVKMEPMAKEAKMDRMVVVGETGGQAILGTEEMGVTEETLIKEDVTIRKNAPKLVDRTRLPYS